MLPARTQNRESGGVEQGAGVDEAWRGAPPRNSPPTFDPPGDENLRPEVNRKCCEESSVPVVTECRRRQRKRVSVPARVAKRAGIGL